MKSVVNSGHPIMSPRCTEIRGLLEDFAAERLGPVARGSVQAHLLTCDPCSDVFAELLVTQVEDGTLPLLTPPDLPSSAVYDTYLRARRPSSSWRAVLDAMVDPAARDWAAARIEEIRAGFALFTDPVATRGAIRTRGAVTKSAGVHGSLAANVLTPAGEPSGTVVTFRVRTLPAITTDGRFGFAIVTDDAAYDGRRVLCAIALPNGQPLSFESTLVRRGGHGAATALFDEHNLPAGRCSIPMTSVTVTIP